MISGVESSDDEPWDSIQYRRPLLDRASPPWNHVQYGASSGDVRYGTWVDDGLGIADGNTFNTDGILIVTDPSRSPVNRISSKQKLTLAILCSSSISSAMFYSLLAPFFSTEAKLKGASDFEIGLCFAIRCTDAIGAAASSTAANAIAANTFPLRISTIMGLLQAFGCAGLTLGPFFGGILFYWRGFYLPFFVCGGIFMLCCLLSLVLLPPVDGEVAEVEMSSNTTKHQLLLLRTPAVLVVGLLALASQSALGFIDVALAMHIYDIKTDIKSIYVGVIFLIPSAIVILLAPVYGYITDKHVRLRRPAMIAGAVAGAVAMLGLGPSPIIPFLPHKKLGVLISSLVVAAIGWATMPLSYAEFVLAARKHDFPDNMATQGIVAGVNSAFNSLGAFVGPIVGGFVLEAVDFDWSSTYVAFLILFAVIVFALYCIVDSYCATCGIARHRDPLDDQQQIYS